MQSLANGSHLGGYAILRLVGRGGMGEVYEAFEHKLQRHVALKIVSSGDHDHEELVSRFLTEARTLARVNHPNVVTIYSIDRVNGIQYIAMEFVDGVPLKELLRGQELSTDEALPLFEQMLEGLKCLHDNRIIHRDLKPHNILIRGDLQVKILDFGIAKSIGENSDHTVAGVVVGTIPYMPPEVKVGIAANNQSDIWSLGAIFYESLVGKQLAKVMSGHSDQSKIIFPEDVEAAIPDAMKKFIGKLCAFRPVDRFQSAEAALEELRKIKAARQQVPAEVFEALEMRVSRIVERSRTDSEKQLKAIQQNAPVSLKTPISRPDNRGKANDGERFKFNDRENTLNMEKVPYRWVAVAIGISILIGSIFGIKNMSENTKNNMVTSGEVQPLPERPVIAAPVVLTEPRDKQSLWLEPTELPTFKWSRELKSGEYQIQVATDQSFQKIVIQEPVTGQFYRPARVLDEANYHWRLVPLDIALPKIDSRSFVLSSREPVELTKPDSQHIYSLKGQGGFVNPEFSWTCKPGAKLYQFQLSSNVNFIPVNIEKNVSTCQFSESKLSAGTYYWRVRVEEQAISEKIWSESRKFVILNGVSNQIVNRDFKLGEPRILNPKSRLVLRLTSDGRSLASLSEGGSAVTLSWSSVSGARGYLVQLSRFKSFSELLSEESTTSTQFQWKYPVAGQIYWRVKAFNSEKESTNFSKSGLIEVMLPAPRLNSSYRLSVSKTQPQAMVNWPAIPSAERYLVQVSSSRDLASLESHIAKEPGFRFSGGVGPKFFRVAAADFSGEVISSFSSVAAVEVKSPSMLAIPTGLMPKNGAKAPARGGRISIVFSWSKVVGANSYQLEVSRDENFKDIIERRQSSNEKSILKQAELSGKVYWRVRAMSPEGNSEWSEPTYFEVK